MGIEGIDHLKGDEMNDEHELEKDSSSSEPVSPGEDNLPKAPVEAVNPVEEHELDSLENEGSADVSEQSQEEAQANDTVDNNEDDTRSPSAPGV